MTSDKNHIHLCPVCRAPSKIALSDQISLSTHLKIASTVVALCAVVFLVAGAATAFECVFAYLPLWSVTEFFHWARMREAAKCKACGFDPILYGRDWKAARLQVETKLNGIVDEMKSRRPSPKKEVKKDLDTTT